MRTKHEHVEIRRVLPTILDVLECRATAQKIVGDVEQVIRFVIRYMQTKPIALIVVVQHIIRFVIRHMAFQNRHRVAGIDQLALDNNLRNQRHTAVCDATGFLRHLEHHRRT